MLAEALQVLRIVAALQILPAAVVVQLEQHIAADHQNLRIVVDLQGQHIVAGRQILRIVAVDLQGLHIAAARRTLQIVAGNLLGHRIADLQLHLQTVIDLPRHLELVAEHRNYSELEVLRQLVPDKVAKPRVSSFWSMW